MYWGPAYLLFAVGALAWSRGKSAGQLRWAALRAPIITGGLVAVYQIVLGILTDYYWYYVSEIGFIFLLTLAIGYAYVGLCLAFVTLVSDAERTSRKPDADEGTPTQARSS